MLGEEQLPQGYATHRGLKTEIVQFTCVRNDLLWNLRFSAESVGSFWKKGLS